MICSHARLLHVGWPLIDSAIARCLGAVFEKDPLEGGPERSASLE